MGKKNNDDSEAKRSLVCILLIAFGVVLIIASWMPLGRVASQAMWTSEDSAAYSKIRQQSHRTAYQSPTRTGNTKAQRKAQQERLKDQAEAMRKKLERARQQPQLWSQYLLWSGTLFTVCGFLGHIANNRE